MTTTKCECAHSIALFLFGNQIAQTNAISYFHINFISAPGAVALKAACGIVISHHISSPSFRCNRTFRCMLAYCFSIKPDRLIMCICLFVYGLCFASRQIIYKKLWAARLYGYCPSHVVSQLPIHSFPTSQLVSFG